MDNPAVVAESPDKPHLCYWVKEEESIEDVFGSLARKLQVQRKKMSRVIIYCRCCEDCSLTSLKQLISKLKCT